MGRVATATLGTVGGYILEGDGRGFAVDFMQGADILDIGLGDERDAGPGAQCDQYDPGFGRVLWLDTHPMYSDILRELRREEDGGEEESGGESEIGGSERYRTELARVLMLPRAGASVSVPAGAPAIKGRSETRALSAKRTCVSGK